MDHACVGLFRLLVLVVETLCLLEKGIGLHSHGLFAERIMLSACSPITTYRAAEMTEWELLFHYVDSCVQHELQKIPKKRQDRSQICSLRLNFLLCTVVQYNTRTIQVHTSTPHSLHWSPQMPTREISKIKYKGKKRHTVMFEGFSYTASTWSIKTRSPPTQGERRGKKCLLSSMKFSICQRSVKGFLEGIQESPCRP